MIDDAATIAEDSVFPTSKPAAKSLLQLFLKDIIRHYSIEEITEVLIAMRYSDGRANPNMTGIDNYSGEKEARIEMEKRVKNKRLG